MFTHPPLKPPASSGACAPSPVAATPTTSAGATAGFSRYRLSGRRCRAIWELTWSTDRLEGCSANQSMDATDGRFAN